MAPYDQQGRVALGTCAYEECSRDAGPQRQETNAAQSQEKHKHTTTSSVSIHCDRQNTHYYLPIPPTTTTIHQSTRVRKKTFHVIPLLPSLAIPCRLNANGGGAQNSLSELLQRLVRSHHGEDIEETHNREKAAAWALASFGTEVSELFGAAGVLGCCLGQL